MSANSKDAGSLAIASPIVAVVGAVFMACCALAASSFAVTSIYDTAEVLLVAGLLAFGLAQLVAMILGIIVLVRCAVRKAPGLPEAVLGIVAACMFALSAFYLLQQAAKPVSA
jgi:hypothetical protein